MADASDHSALLTWAGIAATALGGLFGHLHLRVNRLEDRMAGIRAELQAALGGGDDKLWAELAEMRRDELAFRERLLREVASKDDIRDLRASVERLAADLGGLRVGGI
jgi:outer membrane murein-binding lipoprotein Lpp